MLTEQAVLVAGPDGGRAAVRYAAGVVVTTSVIVVAIALIGRAMALPSEAHLDATLDLVQGSKVNETVMVSSRDGAGRSAQSHGRDDWRASGSRRLGRRRVSAIAMATKVTTLALIAPAAKEISRADIEIAAVASARTGGRRPGYACSSGGRGLIRSGDRA